jgi:hypothetical protein
MIDAFGVRTAHLRPLVLPERDPAPLFSAILRKTRKGESITQTDLTQQQTKIHPCPSYFKILEPQVARCKCIKCDSSPNFCMPGH